MKKILTSLVLISSLTANTFWQVTEKEAIDSTHTTEKISFVRGVHAPFERKNDAINATTWEAFKVESASLLESLHSEEKDEDALFFEDEDNPWFMNGVNTFFRRSFDTVRTVLVKAAFVFQNNVAFLGKTLFWNPDMSGFVVLPAGQTSVTVEFQNAYDHEPVITISPLDAIIDHSVSVASENGFDITINVAQSRDVEFNWIAIAPACSDARSWNTQAPHSNCFKQQKIYADVDINPDTIESSLENDEIGEILTVEYVWPENPEPVAEVEVEIPAVATEEPEVVVETPEVTLSEEIVEVQTEEDAVITDDQEDTSDELAEEQEWVSDEIIEEEGISIEDSESENVGDESEEETEEIAVIDPEATEAEGESEDVEVTELALDVSEEVSSEEAGDSTEIESAGDEVIISEPLENEVGNDETLDAQLWDDEVVEVIEASEEEGVSELDLDNSEEAEDQIDDQWNEEAEVTLEDAVEEEIEVTELSPAEEDIIETEVVPESVDQTIDPWMEELWVDQVENTTNEPSVTDTEEVSDTPESTE